MWRASVMASAARASIVSPSAIRRPLGKRSSVGPTTGRQQGERRHRDQQVERDLAAGLTGLDRQELRARQRDRDQRIAGGTEERQLQQRAPDPTRRRRPSAQHGASARRCRRARRALPWPSLPCLSRRDDDFPLYVDSSLRAPCERDVVCAVVPRLARCILPPSDAPISRARGEPAVGSTAFTAFTATRAD